MQYYAVTQSTRPSSAFIIATLLVLPLSTLGCGSSPAAPNATTTALPAPVLVPPLVLLSGVDGRPVAGATVHVAGQALPSDAAGRVELPSGTAGSLLVEIEAAGFLRRRSYIPGGVDQRLFLWPAERSDIGLTEEYTRKLAYTWSHLPVGSATRPMLRPARGITRVAITVSPELQAERGVVEAVRHAASRLAATTGLVVIVGPGGPGDASVEISLEPQAEAECGNNRGCVLRRRLGDEITGAAVKYISPRTVPLANPGLHLHELGHVLGLEHSLRASDLMYQGFYFGLDDFTPAEAVTLRMMLQRAGGNRFPDDDAIVASTGHAQSIDVVSCGGY